MKEKHPARQVEFPVSEREKELEAIVRKIMPALRDIAWCHLVWNDQFWTNLHAQWRATELTVLIRSTNSGPTSKRCLEAPAMERVSL